MLVTQYQQAGRLEVWEKRAEKSARMELKPKPQKIAVCELSTVPQRRLSYTSADQFKKVKVSILGVGPDEAGDAFPVPCHQDDFPREENLRSLGAGFSLLTS